MLLAKRSGETAVKNQQNMFFALEIGKAMCLPGKIDQFEIWGSAIQGYFWHTI
jgi:hypothetical protein